MPSTTYTRTDSLTLEAAGKFNATNASSTMSSSSATLNAHIPTITATLPYVQASNTTTSCPGLSPSAVLNVEFPRGSNSLSRSGSSARATGSAAAAAGPVESWPCWLLRLGLTAIMLPFRLVGRVVGAQQAYEPLPQAPAAESARGQAQAPEKKSRPERPVEFYNGENHDD